MASTGRTLCKTYKQRNPNMCEDCTHCDLDGAVCTLTGRQVIVERLRNCRTFKATDNATMVEFDETVIRETLAAVKAIGRRLGLEEE